MSSSIRLTRQVSSMPQTHRLSTLQAISQKTHAITSEIQHLKIKANRLSDLIKTAPGDGQSKLDWIHRQLHQP